jgi:Protein of unknown function (DUF1643)
MIHPNYATIPKVQLESLFDVSGYFYVGKAGIKCRSYLNIKIQGEDIPDEPDLMVVMMNPGASVPLTDGDDGRKEVPAAPDDTQNRIMRVMLAKGFRFARVLNLSDSREKDSSAFLKQINILDNVFPDHTIFRTSRNKEFHGLFNTSAKLIVGWGCDNKLTRLAVNALGSLSASQIVGVPHVSEAWAYHHPGRCKNWRDKIVAQL